MESIWECTVNHKTVLQRIAKKVWPETGFHLSALNGIIQEEKYCSGKEERFTCLPQYDKGTLQGKDCSGKVEKMPLIPTIKWDSAGGQRHF